MHIIQIVKNLKMELHQSFLQLDRLELKYVLTSVPALRGRIEELMDSIEEQKIQLKNFEHSMLAAPAP